MNGKNTLWWIGLDKELIVFYQILDLEKADIDKLLYKTKLIKMNLKYIADNSLDSLLKNILIVQSIIKNYNEYKTKAITYIDIYIDIIKQQLSIKGKIEMIPLSKDLAERYKYIFSLATYMILNRKATISSILVKSLFSSSSVSL